MFQAIILSCALSGLTCGPSDRTVPYIVGSSPTRDECLTLLKDEMSKPKYQQPGKSFSPLCVPRSVKK